jgi:hypothetical protein
MPAAAQAVDERAPESYQRITIGAIIGISFINKSIND